jgi:hypothetical protein
MNAIETKFTATQSRARGDERKRAFILPSAMVICLDVSSPIVGRFDVAAALGTTDVVRFGGTSCSMPLRQLNESRRVADLVLFVADNRSWTDFGASPTGHGKRLATMAEEWMLFRARSPRARLVLIDLGAHGMTRVLGHPEVLQVGGFSDAMFHVISLFAAGKLDVEH